MVAPLALTSGPVKYEAVLEVHVLPTRPPHPVSNPDEAGPLPNKDSAQPSLQSYPI